MAKKISSVPHLKLKMTDLAVLEQKKITSCEIQLKSEESTSKKCQVLPKKPQWKILLIHFQNIFIAMHLKVFGWSFLCVYFGWLFFILKLTARLARGRGDMRKTLDLKIVSKHYNRMPCSKVKRYQTDMQWNVLWPSQTGREKGQLNLSPIFPAAHLAHHKTILMVQSSVKIVKIY